jgi:hypothetical protein
LEPDNDCAFYWPKENVIDLFKRLKIGETLLFPFSELSYDSEFKCIDGISRDRYDGGDVLIGNEEYLVYLIKLDGDTISINQGVQILGSCSYQCPEVLMNEIWKFTDDMDNYVDKFILK